MEGLKISIPQRLFYLRAIVTIGLIVSFLLSLNLWGGERYFPSIPVFEHFFLKPPFDFVLVILSIGFLICSLVFYTTRTFIFLALLINFFLVLFDLNRLQSWFYVYNAILIVFMFYDGRVDNPNKFTSVFIFVQLIIASVYVFNGMSQLMNPFFMVSDFYDVILPLKKIMSERQFYFFLKFGKIVPFIVMFVGVGALIRPVKYLAISIGVIMHLTLLVLLFPSPGNQNYSLWFMNLVFGFSLLFLFSGQTQQRYFSISVLFQKPLFYLIIVAFWIMPTLHRQDRWPGSLSFNFKSGFSPKENLPLSENEYQQLPLYVRSFCVKNNDQYLLRLRNWCGHELKSEYFSLRPFAETPIEEVLQIAGENSKPHDELSMRTVR